LGYNLRVLSQSQGLIGSNVKLGLDRGVSNLLTDSGRSQVQVFSVKLLLNSILNLRIVHCILHSILNSRVLNQSLHCIGILLNGFDSIIFVLPCIVSNEFWVRQRKGNQFVLVLNGKLDSHIRVFFDKPHDILRFSLTSEHRREKSGVLQSVDY